MRISDWSSDVCSSDLGSSACRNRPNWRGTGGRNWLPDPRRRRTDAETRHGLDRCRPPAPADRKSVVEGKSVSVRVDIGGRRIIKKKKKMTEKKELNTKHREDE